MKINRLLILLFLSPLIFLYAQEKQLSLVDIWKNDTFEEEDIELLSSMADGQHYSVLNYDWKTNSSSIDLYSYLSQEKTKTVVNSSNLPTIQKFFNYSFSKDERKVLLATEEERIYRHSYFGKYFVYDVKAKTITPVCDSKIQEPSFSPDGNRVAYVKDNDLYLFNLIDQKTKRLTFDGKKNETINGIADWVYEEEFSFVRAYEWNADGTQLAYLKFDESQVPEFSMDIYEYSLYPGQETFKYPKAGEKNAEVSLHIIELKTGNSTELKPTKQYSDFYIPRIKWTNNSELLSAQYLNRHQNELDLWLFDLRQRSSYLVLEERDEAYVEVGDDLTFLADNSFIWLSEADGFNHIYHYTASGKLIKQVTKGDWEVTSFYGLDEGNEKIYYQSVENNSINREVYTINLNGKGKKRLSSRVGTNAASFSADFGYYINTFSSATTPPVYTLCRSKDGQGLKRIKDNQKLLTKLSPYQLPQKEFSTLKVNGNELNMWMIKPSNFDENKTYPLLMYQYSGPGSQSVSNRWNRQNDYWHYLLAQNGIIIVCVDGRGTGFKGAAFKKITQNQLGKYEVEDQIEAAKQLGSLPYIDKNRIGIWGWSYGGFMSSNALFKGNDIFKMGIAVAPVTNWRNYDTVYTERYMTTPQENPSGYDDNSPINHVAGLKGEFLLVHGSADDNVHLQNTMQMVKALIQADKDFEWAIYPDKNHGIRGGNTRLHLFRKMTNFVRRTLSEEDKNEGKISNSSPEIKK